MRPFPLKNTSLKLSLVPHSAPCFPLLDDHTVRKVPRTSFLPPSQASMSSSPPSNPSPVSFIFFLPNVSSQIGFMQWDTSPPPLKLYECFSSSHVLYPPYLHNQQENLHFPPCSNTSPSGKFEDYSQTATAGIPHLPLFFPTPAIRKTILSFFSVERNPPLVPLAHHSLRPQFPNIPPVSPSSQHKEILWTLRRPLVPKFLLVGFLTLSLPYPLFLRHTPLKW